MDPYLVSKNFMPFSGGTRQCTGAEFSKLLMATFLHVLLTKYEYVPVSFLPFQWHLLLFVIRQDHVACFCTGFCSRIVNGFSGFEFLNHRWTRIKGGRVVRGPMLGFRDGFHVKFSPNHN